MTQIDPTRRSLDLKVVYWGSARGGKTTTLRSLHGACDPDSRGTLSSVETQDERTYYFDYTPLDLPRWRNLSLRVHAYTVPGQESYVETRKRILRGASAVVFVADATPGAATRTLASWRQLDDALRALEAGGLPIPVVVAANKQDLPRTSSAPTVARTLCAAVPGRAPVAVLGTSALSGRGVVACFRDAVLSALARQGGTPGDPAEEDAFREALVARLGGGEDGIAAALAAALSAPRRAVAVPTSSLDPDAGGLEAALAATEWLRARDEAIAALAPAPVAPRVVPARVAVEASPTDVAWDQLACLREALERLDAAKEPAAREEALRDARLAVERMAESLRGA